VVWTTASPLTKERVVRDFLKKGSNASAVPPYCVYDDIEYEPPRKEIFRPSDVEEAAPWISPGIRRGVDAPFATKPSHLGGTPTTTATLPPPLPLSPSQSNCNAKQHLDQRLAVHRKVQRVNDVDARPETTSQFSSHYHHARKDRLRFLGRWMMLTTHTSSEVIEMDLRGWAAVQWAGGKGKSRRWI
jgi:hypothetical protein